MNVRKKKGRLRARLWSAAAEEEGARSAGVEGTITGRLATLLTLLRDESTAEASWTVGVCLTRTAITAGLLNALIVRIANCTHWAVRIISTARKADIGRSIEVLALRTV